MSTPELPTTPPGVKYRERNPLPIGDVIEEEDKDEVEEDDEWDDIEEELEDARREGDRVIQ